MHLKFYWFTWMYGSFFVTFFLSFSFLFSFFSAYKMWPYTSWLIGHQTPTIKSFFFSIFLLGWVGGLVGQWVSDYSSNFFFFKT